GRARESLATDPARRMQSAPLAYADGILVCPTNAGAVVAVNLATRTLLWSHSYLNPEPRPTPNALTPPPFAYANLRPEWRYAAPCIEDGKVLVSSTDASELQCLNLRDGTPVWSAPRGADRYVAGAFEGKVLMVGPES